MIWIVGNSSNEFVASLARFLTMEKKPFALTESFDEIRFSIQSDDIRHASRVKAFLTGAQPNWLDTVSKVVNLITNDDFWLASNSFELEEKRASFWAFLAALECTVINRPSARGFFPWIDPMDFSYQACITQEDFETQDYYYVRGKLIDPSRQGIIQDHEAFWAKAHRTLVDRKIDLCQLSISHKGSSIHLSHATTIIKGLSNPVMHAIHKELLR